MVLQGCGVSQRPRSTFVVTDPSEIVRALVGLKDVRVLAYTRNGPDVELVIEQVVGQVRCPACSQVAQVKERPVVHYVDLPVYGTPMSLAWKKHRMRCPNPDCAKRSWVLEEHRIAAKQCLLTTRAAKWATRQVGGGRTVSEVADELACDWHTVNDAVCTYGEALLEADRKRMNKTSAIGLDETSFVRLGTKAHTAYATTVADVEHHQIIEILPSRTFTDVAAWLDKQPQGWKERIRYGALDMSSAYAAVYRSCCPRRPRSSTPSMSSHWRIVASTPCEGECRANRPDIGGAETIRSIGPGASCSSAKKSSTTKRPSACGHCSRSATRAARWPSHTASRSVCATSIAPSTPTRPWPCSKSSRATA